MTRTRRRVGVALGAAALVGAAALTSAGPASAFNPCWGDDPPPRCSDPSPVPAPHPPATTWNEVVATTTGPIFYNGNDHNQWQQTTASLIIVHDSATGSELRAYLQATTRTRTDDAFAGFRATAWVTGGPAYFETLGHRFGVDGPMVPFGAPSDRTDQWQDDVTLDVAKSERGGTLYAHSTFG